MKNQILVSSISAGILAIALVAVQPMQILADHTTPGYLDITGASADNSVLSMTVADRIKEIPEGKADHLITFWGWVVPSDDGLLTVAAIAIHHGANDHQVFDKSKKSIPVQSFHPHLVKADANNCVAGLESPRWDFRIKDNTAILNAEGHTWAGAAVTGWIQPQDDGCFKVLVAEILQP